MHEETVTFHFKYQQNEKYKKEPVYFPALLHLIML